MKIIGLICIGVLAVISSLWWGCGPHRPDDALLEKQFSKQRRNFERLVKMMDEDSQMSRIAPDFTWRKDNLSWPRPESEWGISKQRWNDYKRMFAEVGLRDGTTRRENSSDILLVVWSSGIVPSGVSISFLYCDPPRNGFRHTEIPCTEKKDSGRAEGNGNTYRYKEIAQDWYIIEESN
jgi:hypothetical protein